MPRPAEIECGQEFLPRLRLTPKHPEHAAGHETRGGLVDAARRHTAVRRLDHHGDALRLQHLVQAVRDLSREAFLDLQPLRIGFDQTRELGNAHHAVARQIADVRTADDRRHVVLAMGFEADIAQHDNLVIPVDLLEGALKEGLRVFPVAAEPLLIGARDPRRGCGKPLAGRIIARPADQRADSGFGFRAGWTGGFIARPLHSGHVAFSLGPRDYKRASAPKRPCPGNLGERLSRPGQNASYPVQLFRLGCVEAVRICRLLAQSAGETMACAEDSGRKTMRKTLLLSAALLALSIGAASAQKPIKIGFVSTFSGPTAVIGNDMRNSFELAL